MPKWTKEQEDAIFKKGKNIIVSAGAGSGKTAVLSERVLSHLKNGVDIDKLLILTFTKAAAAEMKERIRKKISENDELKDQLDKVDSAYITTFDAYALSLVKKYSHLLNISKDVTIVDASIISLKKKQLLEEIFEEYYKEDNLLFNKLINDFCLKDDKEIFESILSLNNKLDNIIDKQAYLNNYIKNTYNEEKINGYIKEYLNFIKEKQDTIKNQLKNISFYVENNYLEKLQDVLTPLLNAKEYEDIKHNTKIKLPNIPKNTEEEAKGIKKEISTLIKDIDDLTKYESIDEIKESLYLTKDYIQIIIEIILKLDKKINEYKTLENAYEFIDISHKAINLLKEFPKVKEELKNTYYEILIDEYQDTNDLQEMFISYIENNNVYMVGDIKQSIYRFRNTNPLLFKNKYDLYSKTDKGIKIDLNKNFRSRSDVLDAINILFNVIMDDDIGGANYIESHQMVFGNTAYNDINKENYKLEILNYEKSEENYTNEEIEIFTIANDIKTKVNNYEIMDKETNQKRKVNYSDFVILLDRSSSFNQYKKIFEYLNIPLTVYRDKAITNSVDIYLIKNIYNLIISIYQRNYNENFKYAFMSISRSYLIEENDNEIFKTIKTNNYEKTELYKKCQKLSKNLDVITNYELLTNIINEFNFYEKIIKDKNINEHLIILESLLKTAINCDKLGYNPFTFKDYLNEILDEGLEIKFSLNKETNNSVKIMTIHASKGLEYPICYYAGLAKKFNIDDLKQKIYFSNNFGFIIPYYKDGLKTTILKTLLKREYLKEEVSEKLRLFYVALTRAREKMIIVANIKPNTLAYYDNGVVNNEVRLKYLSFLDILNSAYRTIEKYITNIDLSTINLTKKYNLNSKVLNINEFSTVKPIEVNEINIVSNTLKEEHFSKNVHKLRNNEEQNNIEFGLKMHSIFENIDFQNPNYNLLTNFETNKVKAFINTKILEDAKKIFKEYEFIYEENNEEYHGIIDLLIIKENENIIVDYKLKNTEDEAYIKQLTGYKNYIEKITNKKTEIYLYSILDEKLQKITEKVPN